MVLSQARKACTADCPRSYEALSKSFMLFLDKLREMQVDSGQGRERRGLGIIVQCLPMHMQSPRFNPRTLGRWGHRGSSRKEAEAGLSLVTCDEDPVSETK